MTAGATHHVTDAKASLLIVQQNQLLQLCIIQSERVCIALSAPKTAELLKDKLLVSLQYLKIIINIMHDVRDILCEFVQCMHLSKV